jgi:hypothetical protein
MHTYMPYETYEESVKVLPPLTLQLMLNGMWASICSLAAVYPINPVTGASGMSGHIVTRFWRGHELQLLRFALVAADELIKRPLGPTTTLAKRRAVRDRLRGAFAIAEEEGLGDTKPSLIGDPAFHSAFRAMLLHYECRTITYRAWRRGEYPTTLLPPLPEHKRSWRYDDYEAIWAVVGRPHPPWYGQFGWTEEPNATLVFYETDRIPYYVRDANKRGKALRRTVNEEKAATHPSD